MYDESRQRDLFLDDEEEDFLDECIVNPTGLDLIIKIVSSELCDTQLGSSTKES